MKGKELILDDDLLADGYEDCIIGIATVIINDVTVRKVIYDAQAMVEQLAREFKDSGNSEDPYEEALEYLEFNTFGAYVGEQTPLYLWEEAQIETCH